MTRHDAFPTNHLLIAPTRRESEHLKQQGFNSTHNPFGNEDCEYDNSLEDLDGKTIIVLHGLGSDDSTTEVLETIIGGWLPCPPLKVILSDEITNLKREQLLEAIQEAILADRKKGVSLGFKDAIIRAEDFLSKNIPPKRMILRPWLAEQSINPIAGWRGTGKTWFAASVADAITKGKSFGPWPTETPVPVLYVDGELPSADVQERFRVVDSIFKGKRKAPLHIYSDCYANSLGLQKASLLNQEWKEAIKGFLIKEGIKILVLDNISSLAPGIDENPKKDWDPINQWFLELRFSGISTIPIFHAGKNKDQRGTSAHEDNVDKSIMLSPPSGYSPQQGARFILKFKKKRVKNTDLHLIIDYEFSFSEVGGRAKWTWGAVKGNNAINILARISAGVKQSEIAKALEVDRSLVSRTKTNAIKKGLLTEDGNLTPEGIRLINPGDSDEEF